MTGSGVFAVEYQTSIRALKGVGEKRAQLFEKLGADTVGALLQLYPRQYEDWSQVTRIDAAPFDKNCCIKARPVGEVREHRIRKGMTLYKVTVSDGHSRMRITIFNNKYAAAKLKPGHDFLFFGKAGGNFNGREMTSPMIEEAGTGERIRPIYPQTAGLPSRAIESAVAQALNEMKENLEDPLPEALRQRYSLCHRRFALENIHFPVSREACEIAKKRLVFEELLILQLTAQAMCLEEMMEVRVSQGAVFYFETRRREKVEFTDELRATVRNMAAEMNKYYRQGYTPKVRKSAKCRACSLQDICLPGLQKLESARSYVERTLGE